MDWPHWVEIVQLESLNERTVQQGGGRCSRSAVPSYDRVRAATLQAEDRIDRCRRPRQPGTYKSAGKPVQHEKLRFLAHLLRHLSSRKNCEPACELTGGASWVGWQHRKLITIFCALRKYFSPPDAMVSAVYELKQHRIASSCRSLRVRGCGNASNSAPDSRRMP